MHGAASRPGPKPSLTRSSLLVILLVDADALGNLGSTLRVVPGSQDDSGVELSVPLCISPASGFCKVDALTCVIQAYSGVHINKGKPLKRSWEA